MCFPKYSDDYGGLDVLVASKYFWLSVVAAIVCSRYFGAPGWWDLVLGVVPGLVGFSIAGVAIFVSLGSDKLRASLAGAMPNKVETSPFIDFMAMFTHFIVTQLIALVVAIVSKALYQSPISAASPLVSYAEPFKEPLWWLGGFFFIYAVLLCVALAVEIYRLATIIDDFQTRENAKLFSNQEDEG